jgi:hypothetical protein
MRTQQGTGQAFGPEIQCADICDGLSKIGEVLLVSLSLYIFYFT